jgi:hypothetical protein
MCMNQVLSGYLSGVIQKIRWSPVLNLWQISPPGVGLHTNFLFLNSNPIQKQIDGPAGHQTGGTNLTSVRQHVKSSCRKNLSYFF